MAVEDDILKTLIKIEGILKNSSSTLGGRRTSFSIFGGGKAGNAEAGSQKSFKATAASTKSLGDAADDVTKKFTRLSRTVQVTSGHFAALNRSLRAARATSASRPTGGTAGPNVNSPAIIQANRALSKFSSDVSVAGIALTSAVSQIIGAIGPLTDDFFRLQSRGIDATSSMVDLYLASFRSGMALQDYTQVLDNSTAALVRSGSLEAFNDRLRQTSSELGRLGIFGQSATQLAATMQTAAVTVGVPQNQLADATNRQIKVFEQLRKTSLLTAEGFQELIAATASNENVQSELLGLAPQERAARLLQLTQTQAIGRQMGLSAEQSKALGEALLAQRKLTSTQRFQAAGRIRQAGAYLGMDAGETEELSRLALKKNRTADEQRRFVEIGGRMERRIQEGMNSNNFQQVYAAEQFSEMLSSTGIGEQLRAAGSAALTSESGPVIIKGIGKDTSAIAQDIGEIATLLQGFAKNPVGDAIMGALGSVAFAGSLALAIRSGLGPLARILGQAERVKVAGGVAGAVLDTKGGGKFGNVLSTVWNSTKTFVTKVTDLRPLADSAMRVGSKFGDVVGTVVKGTKSGAAALSASFQILRSQFSILGIAGEASKGLLSGAANLGKSLLTGIGGALKGAFNIFGRGGVLGAIFGGLSEMVFGEMNSALNAESGTTWFGDGLSGFLSKGFGKVVDVINGAIRGFFTSITGLGDFVIDAWNWTVGSFFDEAKIKLDASLTNMFDQAWVWMNIKFKEIALFWVEKFGFEGAAKSLRADIEVARSTQEKLKADGEATLTTIGAANQAASEEQKRVATEAKKSVDQATQAVGAAAGVVTSTKNLASMATRTAAILASPVAPTRPSVTQQEVNRPAGAPASAPTTEATGTSNTAPTASLTDALTGQFSRIISLLEQTLSAEQTQAVAVTALARATGRPMFADNIALAEGFLRNQG